MLAEHLPRSWAAALRQLERDVTTVGRRALGHHASPLVKGYARGLAPARSAVRGREEARELLVAEVIRETADAFTLVLRAAGGEPFAFHPGQFFTLLTVIDGEVVPRNYSASNAPGSPELHLTIKAKAGGRVSPVLARTPPGERLQVLGPFGSFTVAPSEARRRLVLIAGGSGITPLASIARATLATYPLAEIALVVANRRAEDIILAGALEALSAQHQDRFTLLHVLEEPPPGFRGETGRLDRQTAARALEGLALAGHAEATFFVCGPDAMRDEVLAALAARGVAEPAIRIERFAIGPRPQVTASGAAFAAPGARPLSIRVKDRTYRTVVLPGATVLEAGLAAGADMPFSCAVGGCGACRVKVTSGAVDVEEPNCLSDAERAAGYVLACVGRPCGPCTVEVP
ncbi:MAG TPA: ferredoxin--NADP reductase [Labilithrix sp.]|nr:ferredoxin--NADP reductase [Labilithrix sp.]